MSAYDAVYAAVRAIPAGKVASYGQVARAIGLPRGARLVGWALRALPQASEVPWQRVVNREGMISIINPVFPKNAQKALLEGEGLAVAEREGCFYVIDPSWHDFSAE